mgnify:CR=1 FL=1
MKDFIHEWGPLMIGIAVFIVLYNIVKSDALSTTLSTSILDALNKVTNMVQ